MGRIFITLCPVGQPKQRKYQPFKSPDYDNNSRKTKDPVCGVGGGGAPEYRALVWLMQGCFSSVRHREGALIMPKESRRVVIWKKQQRHASAPPTAAPSSYSLFRRRFLLIVKWVVLQKGNKKYWILIALHMLTISRKLQSAMLKCRMFSGKKIWICFSVDAVLRYS